MQQVKLQELSYYELYLLNYLKEYHPEKVDDIDFIKERSDNAAILFEKSRLDGKTVMDAQEIAMKELMKGLHFSKHYLILTIIKDEFEKEVPDDKVLLLIKRWNLTLIPFLQNTHSQMTLNNLLIIIPYTLN